MTRRVWAPLTLALAGAGILALRGLQAGEVPKPREQTMSTDGKYAKPDDADLRRRLTPEQYDVTQKEGTEPPFRNTYWDNHAPGIYVDVVTGEPLFSSLDKYDSGTGWPSFTKPLEPGNVDTREDR